MNNPNEFNVFSTPSRPPRASEKGTFEILTSNPATNQAAQQASIINSRRCNKGGNDGGLHGDDSRHSSTN